MDLVDQFSLVEFGRTVYFTTEALSVQLHFA